MRFVYGKHDWPDRERGQENCYLLTNGLGGFSSGSMISSNARNDHALLMAAIEAPNVRYNMVNRLEETLEAQGEPENAKIFLSSQEFEDDSRNENGYNYLDSFVFEDYPEWTFHAAGAEVVKRLAMRQGENLVAVEYRIDNRSDRKVRLTVVPHLQFAPKGKELKKEPEFETGSLGDGLYRIASGSLCLFFRTDGVVEMFPRRFCEGMFYAYDACDGRNALGRTCVSHRITRQVPPHSRERLEIIYLAEGIGGEEDPRPEKEAELRRTVKRLPRKAEEVFAEAEDRARRLRETARRQNPGLRDETALQLAAAAGQFVSERPSVGGRTLLAGYPFFEDWGRDTMIALEGCCMVTGQMDTARSILRTFARYCRRGLLPNLFPEGGRQPMYNTADAALLFVNGVFRYYARTLDGNFVREMWPVLTNILDFYRSGTDYGIHMDEDGLIMAGRGLEQVTWMDVRIGDFLPTPRHGKPVEINAYWYNALRAMERMAGEVPGVKAGFDYGGLAKKVRSSFLAKFWMEEKGYLRDVISCGEGDDGAVGGKADEQFRCSQIWAVSMPFAMLDRKKEIRVVDAVYEKLYTPLGLRTLERDDPDFHGACRGPAQERDAAYHQGTVWVFPLGAYYLAYLKTRDYSARAVACVRRQLRAIENALREGCIGQLPEIYDGENPTFSRGCYAQAWSVGEMLRVYEELGRQEAGTGESGGKDNDNNI